jgi:hypothetical protein
VERAALYDYADGSRFIGKSVQDFFTEIAQENVWQEQETLSGIGSLLAQTQMINSGSIWLMMTTIPQEEHNQDIPTGGWRPINL